MIEFDSGLCGPTIGPVTLASTGHTAPYELISYQDDEIRKAKLLIVVHAELGSTVTVSGAEGGDGLRFSHGGRGEFVPAATRRPPLGDQAGLWLDMPGEVEAARPGVYYINVTVDDTVYGPFEVLI